MSKKKISQLPAILNSDISSADILPIVDLSESITKKISLLQIFNYLSPIEYKGEIDCSTNPNYPAADIGHSYKISVAGKIGGALGLNVLTGDLIICLVDSTPSGNQATVGSNWIILQSKIDFISTSISVTNTIPASTTFSVTSSGLNYTKSGADGNLRASSALFNSTGNVSIYLNGVYQDKGVHAIWVSSTSFNLDTIVDNGDEIIILS
jgi:hypothetical protein